MTHPRRLELARRLCERHPELDLQIAVDPEPDGVPSAWRTAREAWRAVAPGATHHLVLQDDLTTAEDFPARVLAAVAARPQDALSLFVEWGSRTASAVRVAAALGKSWAPVVDDYIPCAALVLPAAAAAGFDDFAAANSSVTDPDDVVLLEYLHALGLSAVALVDGPVQHDDCDSLVGNFIMGVRRSVQFSERSNDHLNASILADLDAVPYYDWWDQQAAMFVPDASSMDGWARIRSGPAFEHLGVSVRAVEAAFEAEFPSVPNRPQLDDRVSAIIAREIWKTAYMLGVVVSDKGGAAGAASDERFLAALATLAPGGLRRVTPTKLLGVIADLLLPLVVRGVECGIRNRSLAPVLSPMTDQPVTGRSDLPVADRFAS